MTTSNIEGRLPAIIGATAVAIFLLINAVFIVQETEQVLVTQFGNVRQQIKDPGLHFKLPLIEQVRVFEKRILNVDPPAEEVLLSDQKRLVVDSFARYRITDMLTFFKTMNSEGAALQRLSTIINSSVRSNLGKVPMTDILSEKRDALMRQIQKDVNNEVTRFGIQVVDLRIVRADLPEQVTQATYARMRSEREREAREARAQGEEISLQIRSKADKDRTILLAEAARDAQITRGQGDEQAIKIYAEAFNKDPRFYQFYRSLEAYRKSLADPETTLILSPDNDFLHFFENKPGSR